MSKNEDQTKTEMLPTITQSFLLLKTGVANKIGKHSQGNIHYQILTDIDRQNIFVRVTGNDGGGYFSKEILSIQKVDDCLQLQKRNIPFPSKSLIDAFVGKSSNNAGFGAAILRAEGLLSAAPETASQHLLAGDFAQFKKTMLTETGTPIVIDTAKPGKPIPETETAVMETRKTLKVPIKKQIS